MFSLIYNLGYHSMRLTRVDKTIEVCENLLRSKGDFDKEVESLLTQSVLVVIYAEFERKFKELIKMRSDSVDDQFAKEFLKNRTANYPHGMSKGSIAKCLGEFGNARKEQFNRCMGNDKRIESSYASIVSNRHLVAHGEGSTASFNDVKQFYEDSHQILDYFESAIALEL